MFIQTEKTPNPSTLKFIPGKEVLGEETLQVSTKEQARYTPVAKELFEIEGIKTVFFGKDFISVTKESSIAWDIIQPDILSVIMDWVLSGKAIVSEAEDTDSNARGAASDNTLDSPIVIQIKEIINTKVRPAVASDGGDIIYKDFVDGVVLLELHGACSGCPSSTITLKQGIENMLKYYIPEVQSVEAVND